MLKAEKVEVIIDLDSDLAHFADKQGDEIRQLKTILHQYIDGLKKDLSLPVKVSLKIGLNSGYRKLKGESFIVLINGCRCRQPSIRVVPEEIQSAELAKTIGQVVLDNRELFLSVPLSRRIRKAWSVKSSGECLTRLSDDDFHGYLCLLLRYGFNIDRGNPIHYGELGETMLRNGISPESCFEGAVSQIELLSINLILSKTLYRKRNKSWSSLDEMQLDKTLSMMRDGLFYELGIYLPMVDIRTEEDLATYEFRVQINDLRLIPIDGLKLNQFFVNDTRERLSLLGLSGEYALNPANGNEGSIVLNSGIALDRCNEAGLTVWGPSGFMILALSSEIRQNVGAFLNLELLSFYMVQLGSAFPELTDMVGKKIDTLVLIQVFRNLLNEEISIRNLRAILQALLVMYLESDTDRNLSMIQIQTGTENVRMALTRQISQKHARSGNALVVFLLDPAIEAWVIREGPMNEQDRLDLIESLSNEVGNEPYTRPIILTTKKVRAKLRELLKKEFPRHTVLCYQELSPILNIQPLGRISLGVETE
ncbi:MAG: FHIPEP family type III secretion protein [Candidatus Thorarchaeota archaeon]|jgi:hypothetical protein